MRTKRLFLKTKIYNYHMFNGNKILCELFLLKNVKKLQKLNARDHKDLAKLAIISTAPVIKIMQIRRKRKKIVKEFPFVINKKNRTTTAVKSILKKANSRNKSLAKLLFLHQDQNELISLKKTTQQEAFTKKKYFFFRWFC